MTITTEVSRLLAPMALAACMLSANGQADEVEATWHRRTLDNGLSVLVVHVAQAPRQSSFTFIPLGLLHDEPGRAQFAHVLEHMVIRTTDPDGLQVDGIDINGETTGAALRLDTIAPPERWRPALERHARWLGARSFDATVLEREQGRIAGEESGTVVRGATHKWALAGWNQVVRHGAEHAAVHADAAAADVDVLADYAARYIGPGPGVSLVTVGPVAAEEVMDAIVEQFGELPRLEGDGAVRPAEVHGGDARHVEASWDLGARHLQIWYALPDRDAVDRAAAVVLGQLISIRLAQDSELAGLGVLAMADTQVVTPEGRYLMLSAGLPAGVDVDRVREQLIGVVAGLADREDGSVAWNFGVAMVRRQFAGRPDFASARRAYAAQGLDARTTDLIEAQMMLSLSMVGMQVGVGPEGVAEAFTAVDGDRVGELVDEFLVPADRARSLVLMPAE